ncbi:MAG: hypothetical protein HYV07_27490 [Deltaproteobacteria bacterium]|nr:hypothetical protein [Deltaproteobacteria bacterium]
MLPVSLDDPCSRLFRYRDLVECGETFQALASLARDQGEPAPDNVPREAATLEAMARLCRDVLDPIWDHFGSIELTYGFASPALTRRIHGRIAPSLDQHAGHERGRDGRPVCARLGQAADLHVVGHDSWTVARWVAMTLPFDRLYFYESDRPFHVSVGPDEKREAFELRKGRSGRRYPRRIKSWT